MEGTNYVWPTFSRGKGEERRGEGSRGRGEGGRGEGRGRRGEGRRGEGRRGEERGGGRGGEERRGEERRGEGRRGEGRGEKRGGGRLSLLEILKLQDSIILELSLVPVHCCIMTLMGDFCRIVKLISPKLNYFVVAGAILLFVLIYVRILPVQTRTAAYIRCNVRTIFISGMVSVGGWGEGRVHIIPEP